VCSASAVIPASLSSLHHAAHSALMLTALLLCCPPRPSRQFHPKLGAVTYACRIPERWYPGKFDIMGHSHQLWHAAVVLAAWVHYCAMMILLQWRDASGGSAQHAVLFLHAFAIPLLAVGHGSDSLEKRAGAGQPVRGGGAVARVCSCSQPNAAVDLLAAVSSTPTDCCVASELLLVASESECLLLRLRVTQVAVLCLAW
jgi:hypothetical protein